METKVCCRCGLHLNSSDFRKDSTKKDGFRPECKTCTKKSEKILRTKNPKWLGERLKKFYTENPDKRKQYRQNYKKRKQEQRKERRKIDPIFVLTNRMRCRLWKYMNVFEIKKTNKTFDIIGCSPSFLKNFLESKFTEGMNWKKRNEWHVDHIIPLSSAKNVEELLKLCHYTNLQPLWAAENIKKGKKF